MGFTTKVLHSGYPKKELYGALRFPIYQNAAFEFDSAEEMEALFRGEKKGHTYTRASNPTVEELELKIKNISGSYGVIATASGMAAISNTLLALLKSGDNIITTKHLFGHTLSFFKTLLPSFGVDVRFVDICDPTKVKSAICKSTKAIFVETISNPQLSTPDIFELSKIAKESGILLICDTTMTPWNIFDAKKAGVDIEIVSSTKYISGGGTVIGGLIIDAGNYDWSGFANLESFYGKFKEGAFVMKLRKETFRNLGAALSPQSAYMLSLGLETLDLRIKKSCQNALALATHLKTKEQVVSVNYPFLECSPYYGTAKRQFNLGGSILSVELKDKKSAYLFLDALKIIRRSTNIQDNKTLAIAPYHTIYAEYTDSEKQEANLKEGMIRLSVGIEDIADLIDDVDSALESAR